jgi:hypothetical protein
MPSVSLLSREVKRVPFDFDAPLGEPWAPRLRQPSGEFPSCPDCGPPARPAFGRDNLGHKRGDGLSAPARALVHTFWEYLCDDKTQCWAHSLTQEDIAAVVESKPYFGIEGVHYQVERGECDCGKNKDCEECYGRGNYTKWIGLRLPTPEEVNGSTQQVFNPFDLSSSDCYTLVRTRCEKRGQPFKCPTCDGYGSVASPEERSACENWVMPDPPQGEGWQMWESVSEGGPISPVFDSPEALASWLADYESVVGREKVSFREWLAIITGEVFSSDLETGELV